jgi:drug/metabolite transporter (DMT)-like permease
MPGGDVVRGAIDQRWLARGGVVFAVFAWGGQFVAARSDITAAQPIDAFGIVALRFAAASLVMLPLAVRWGLHRDFCGLGWRRALAATSLYGAPYALILTGALHFTTVAHASAIAPGTTCLVIVLVPWLFGRETMSLVRVAGLIGICLGLALVTGALASSATLRMLVGDGLVVVSGLMWATYVLAVRRWGVDAWHANAVAMVLSGLFAFPYLIWNGLPDVAWSRMVWTALYQGVIVAVIGNSLFTWAIGVLGTRAPATASPFVPVVATMLAAVLLAEQPTAVQLAGICAIVAGVLSVNLAR